MAIKTRVLCYPEFGKIRNFGECIKKKLDEIAPDMSHGIDKIPPAYACDRERLVFIGVKLGKDVPDELRLFCAALDKSKAANVAMYVTGNPEGIGKLTNILREAGTKVIDDQLSVKDGFLFLNGVKPEEKAQIESWAEKIYKDVEAE